jgi:transcriptional regulator with XRE-family HTH domain
MLAAGQWRTSCYLLGCEGNRDLIEAALIVSDRLPNEIDRHIASRVRSRRLEMGLSQETVANALGVTFQQFQKYERSINRMSAGALYPLALTPQVPVGYFFEGLRDLKRSRLTLPREGERGRGAVASHRLAFETTKRKPKGWGKTS